MTNLLDLQSLPPLREVIQTYALSAKKSLGQHFLLDGNITAKIVRSAGRLDGKTVLEIGPGPGGLTRALLAVPVHQVIAIERDSRAVAALGTLQELVGERLRVVPGDALAIDEMALAAPPFSIIANLPYNIATPLLIKWLQRPEIYSAMVLMFQKEVAERLIAGPGSKAYGRLSVLAQWQCDVDIAFSLPAAAFTPPPKVDSAIVRLQPKPTYGEQVDLKRLQTITQQAFGQRRKMLRSSLARLGVDVMELCRQAVIDPKARADAISVVDYGRLAWAWQQMDSSKED